MGSEQLKTKTVQAALARMSNMFMGTLTIKGPKTSTAIGMSLEEMEDTLIIIFIAETDPDSVFQISSDVQKQFHQVSRNQEMMKKNLFLPIASILNLASWR